MDYKRDFSSKPVNLKSYIALLDSGDKIRFAWTIFLNLTLAMMDLLGIVLIGVLGSVVTLGIQDKEVGGLTQKILLFLGLGSLEQRSLILVLLIGAIFSFSLKSLLNIFVLKRVTLFFEKRAASLAIRTMCSFLFSGGEVKKQFSSGEILHAFSRGVQSIYSQVIAGSIILIGDILLTTILLLGLVLADALMAAIILTYFLILALTLFKITSGKLSKLGKENSNLYIQENQIVREITSSYKQIHAEGAERRYLASYRQTKENLTAINAEFAFNSILTKIVFEIGMLFGITIVIVSQFILNPASTAVALAAVFIAASFRIGPATLRIQQQIILIKVAHQAAMPVWRLLKFFAEDHNGEVEKFGYSISDKSTDELIPRIQFVGVHFTHGNNEKLLHDFNLQIEPGEHLVLIGKSGSGKTTILDLLSGFHVPDVGEVFIGGVNPRKAIEKWPGAIAYVSQDAYLSSGTVREVLGVFPGNYATEAQAIKTLEQVGLAELFVSGNHMVDRNIGENGNLLSGGQRQRLLLAQAILKKPRIIILDEATSALDYDSQFSVNRVIRSIGPGVTVVSVTHRLESISFFDRVVELGQEGLYRVYEKESIPDFVSEKYLN